jgi:DNA-binding CsgD family transcriptional regulator
MNKFERVKYEELYRQVWEKQNKKDKEDNPRLLSRATHRNTANKVNGQMGGRPKKEANRLELTKEAEMVNRMLKRNMTLKSIAEIMGVSPKSASNIKRKYDLPRGEDNG